MCKFAVMSTFRKACFRAIKEHPEIFEALLISEKEGKLPDKAWWESKKSR